MVRSSRDCLKTGAILVGLSSVAMRVKDGILNSLPVLGYSHVIWIIVSNICINICIDLSLAFGTFDQDV